MPTHGRKLPPPAIELPWQFVPLPLQWICRPSSEESFRRRVSKPVHDRAHPRRNVSVFRLGKNGTVPFRDQRAHTREFRSGQRKNLGSNPARRRGYILVCVRTNIEGANKFGIILTTR